jgi:DNA-binding HxlR family transcriptional regulator
MGEDFTQIIESCLSQAKLNPKMIPILSRMWSLKSNYTEQEISDELTLLVEAEKIDSGEGNHHNQKVIRNKNPFREAKQKKLEKKPLLHVNASIKPAKLSSQGWGLSRAKHERKMAIITQLRGLILSKDGQGLSKTALLKRIKKDNSYWRGTISLWLDELVSQGVIQRHKRRYYSPQIYLEPREKMIHRLVFESLQDGPLSRTAIGKRIGCDGGNQRKMLRQAIQELAEEGYIRLEGMRYRWNR